MDILTIIICIAALWIFASLVLGTTLVLAVIIDTILSMIVNKLRGEDDD